MDKRVSTAVVKLNEAEALAELNHFTVPVVMMNPFKARQSDARAKALRMVIAIDFDREVRKRGANHAATKVQQAKDRQTRNRRCKIQLLVLVPIQYYRLRGDSGNPGSSSVGPMGLEPL